MRTSKQLLTAITLLALLITLAYVTIYKVRQKFNEKEEGMTAFERMGIGEEMRAYPFEKIPAEIM